MRCTIYQWRISGAMDGGKPLGRLTRNHMETCECCRRFWRGAMELEAGLLEQSARADAPQVYRPPLRIGPVLAATAGLAAAAVLLVAFLLPPGAKTGPGKPAASEPFPLGRVVQMLQPAESLRAFDELASANLRGEMNRLRADVQAATGAMLSYLPLRTTDNQ